MLRNTQPTYHDIYFLLHLRKHALVRDGDTLQDMVGGTMDGSGSSTQIDMGETTCNKRVNTSVEGVARLAYLEKDSDRPERYIY